MNQTLKFLLYFKKIPWKNPFYFILIFYSLFFLPSFIIQLLPKCNSQICIADLYKTHTANRSAHANSGGNRIQNQNDIPKDETP